MEQSSPVDRSSYTAAPQRAPSFGTATGEPSSFVAQMQDLLGIHAEPDPLFFVDSWTIGLDAAAEKLQVRQYAPMSHDTSAFRAFDFAVPLVFIEEGHVDVSTYTPIGFREAYGIAGRPIFSAAARPQKSAMPDSVLEQPPAFLPDPNQPLTLQSACSLLGVAASSSREQIKSAYRQLVRRYHPDHMASSNIEGQRAATDRMIAINQAYHLLCESRVVAS